VDHHEKLSVKILHIKNFRGPYISQNCLRTALLIGGGHRGCFKENGKC